MWFFRIRKNTNLLAGLLQKHPHTGKVLPFKTGTVFERG
jgi:hypothetical protein